MYDFEWHKSHGRQTSRSAEIVIALLRAFHDPTSVLDVGCGDGRWLAGFPAGTDIVGLDGPWTDQSRLLIPTESFRVADLESRLDLGRRFDLAVSLEVAEHVSAECARQFVDNLTRHADIVLFGAAIPYQGGFRHINERWQSYWAALFDAQGYQLFDPFRGQIWDLPEVSFWYKQNMLLYVRRSRGELIDRVQTYIREQRVNQLPVDIVHPERYEAIASYDQIAFKPLLRRLPARTLGKAYSLLRRG